MLIFWYTPVFNSVDNLSCKIISISPFVSITWFKNIKNNLLDFRGGPVAETPHSQCRGLGSIPSQGWTHIPTKNMHATTENPKGYN